MFKIHIINKTIEKEITWRSIKIKKSLDEICHTLEAELPPSERLKIRKHDRIEVRGENPFIKDSGGKRLITTVLVDQIIFTLDINKNSISVIGRSPLVFCKIQII